MGLDIAGLRNLKSQKIAPGAQGNSLFGANGAGKTSVLEAIYLLSTGRSFRATSFDVAIAYDQPRAVVSAVVANDGMEYRLGVERRRDGSTHARLDGLDLNSTSSLAQQLPCHLLDANTIEVVVGAPKARRQLLDWGVFHVEHGFAALARRFRGVLGQRNALLQQLLKQGDDAQLQFWDSRFSELALQVHDCRARYVASLIPEFARVLDALDAPPVEVGYRPGWAQDRPLAEVLLSSRDSECSVGRTLYGPHRADLRLTSMRRALPQALSRGQQKVVAYALVLAQIRLELQASGRAPVVLVDDLLSELDGHHARRVIEALRQLGVQYFVTAIDNNDWAATDDPILAFHVEQGMIYPTHS